MHKFFRVFRFVLIAISLSMMTGCMGCREVIRQCDMPTYSYKVFCVYPEMQDCYGKFTFEFRPGTPEQREDIKKMPFYKKGQTKREQDAHTEIANCIYMWEQMQQAQQK